MKISKFHRKTPVLESPFYKLQEFIQASNVIKKKSYAAVFVRFEKFLRTLILKNICERLVLCIDYFIIYRFFEFTTVHIFHVYKCIILYYAIKTIELMKHKAVSFEEVFQ